MNVIDLIKTIEKRPSMYISYNSIICLKSFIDGWYFRNENEDVKMEILNDFSKWLQELYKLDDKRGWERIILFYSQDEADALKTFFVFFDNFLKESTHF
jgi:hypothetical protein